MRHPTWQLPVSQTYGSLILTPCPGTKGLALRESLAQLKAQGVVAIVSALSDQELQQKDVHDLGQQAQQLGLLWFQLPITDDAIPDADFAQKWPPISLQLQNKIKQQGHVALHCMGGSGRTGLLAAHLLLDFGWALADIKTQVQALRPNAFTQQLQLAYIEQL